MERLGELRWGADTRDPANLSCSSKGQTTPQAKLAKLTPSASGFTYLTTFPCFKYEQATMIKIGTVFKFAAPDGWQQFQENSRYIFHGPNREELIVSASLIQGIGTSGDREGVQQKLFQNAEQSVKNAAAHPALKVMRPFQREARASNVECWSLHAQTHEGDTLFYQSVCRGPRGVLLATLEAPNTSHSQNIFDQFINSVAVISESEAFVD
jgi:hypothetical protein